MTEVIGDRRKLRNGQLHNLYPSMNNIMVIKSRSMRQERYGREQKRVENISSKT